MKLGESISIFHKILDGLIARYTQRVPEVNAILNAMTKDQLMSSFQDIENDHIAFRTLGIPNLGVASLEKIFLHYGYKKRDHYFFQEKKLDAWWYSPPEKKLPRIFISELRVFDLDAKYQNVIHYYTQEIKSDPVDALDLNDAIVVDRFLHNGLWQLPSWEDYQMLNKASEYAAWVIYNRYYLNHFTISIQSLPAKYNDIAVFSNWLTVNGFKMNDSGGLIKSSADGLLLQCSTVASLVDAVFSDGSVHAIPGSYVEFAERRQGREGFEAASADKIFESTFTEQVKKYK